MDKLLNKLLQVELESETAVEIAEMYFTFKYIEMGVGWTMFIAIIGIVMFGFYKMVKHF